MLLGVHYLSFDHMLVGAVKQRKYEHSPWNTVQYRTVLSELRQFVLVKVSTR